MASNNRFGLAPCDDDLKHIRTQEERERERETAAYMACGVVAVPSSRLLPASKRRIQEGGREGGMKGRQGTENQTGPKTSLSLFPLPSLTESLSTDIILHTYISSHIKIMSTHLFNQVSRSNNIQAI